MSKTLEQLQSEKLLKKICRKMGTTMRDHSLIREGDHVLVGLSGGKDSMILLEALAESSFHSYERTGLQQIGTGTSPK
jgi:tRNA 2-thiocytidine biosynthesis protein TtcA